MCDVIKATLELWIIQPAGEHCELLSVVGKKLLVILLSILPVHKVVKCRVRPLEESN